MLSESVDVFGRVALLRNGRIEQTVNNLIVDAGREHIADVLVSGTPYNARYVQLGTGDVQAANSQTSLVTPVGSRVDGGLVRATNVITVDATFPENNPATEEAIVEAGLFTGANSGIMVARVNFGVVTKSPTDEFRVIWRITIGA